MKRRIVAVALLIMTMVLMLSGCSSLPGKYVKKLSGKYVNLLNDEDYFDFSSSGKVEYHHNGDKFDGTYRITDGVVFGMIVTNGAKTDIDGDYPDGYLEFAGSGDDISDKNGTLLLLEIESKKKLSLGTMVFVKKTFWEKHWLKIVIGLAIAGILIAIYEKATGKVFEEEVDKFFDGDDDDDDDESDYKEK